MIINGAVAVIVVFFCKRQTRADHKLRGELLDVSVEREVGVVAIVAAGVAESVAVPIKTISAQRRTPI